MKQQLSIFFNTSLYTVLQHNTVPYGTVWYGAVCTVYNLCEDRAVCTACTICKVCTICEDRMVQYVQIVRYVQLANIPNMSAAVTDMISL